MGCRWATRAGRRVRVEPVGAPRLAIQIATPSLFNMMGRLGISLLVASPAIPIEELQNAVLRLWKDPELGYMVEARIRPSDPPIYTSITQLEATALEAGTPTPKLLGRLFHTPTVDN